MLVVVVLAASTASAQITPKDDVYLRLWCPRDIETLAFELRERPIPEVPRWFHEDRVLMRDHEIMRRVMYGILSHFPETRETLYYSLPRQNRFKDTYLRTVWELWRSMRMTMWRGFAGALPAADHRDFVVWRNQWGPDPPMIAPGERPPLPQTMDCRWYLSVEYRSAGITYLAVVEKQNGWAGSWSIGNTRGDHLLVDCPSGSLWSSNILPFSIDHTPMVSTLQYARDFELRVLEDLVGSARFRSHRNDPIGLGYFDVEFPLRRGGTVLTMPGRIESTRSADWERLREELARARARGYLIGDYC